MKNILSVIFFFSFLCICVLSQERIDLRYVDAIDFKKDSYAFRTRGPRPAPQLICEYNPTGNDNYLPTSVYCKNEGLDDRDIVIWRCEGDMPDTLMFDKTKVICEGYSGPGDRFVKKGSCALKYTLRISPEGAEKYGAKQDTINSIQNNKDDNSENSKRDTPSAASESQTKNKSHSSDLDFWTILIFVIVVIIFIFILVNSPKNGRSFSRDDSDDSNYCYNAPTQRENKYSPRRIIIQERREPSHYYPSVSQQSVRHYSTGEQTVSHRPVQNNGNRRDRSQKNDDEEIKMVKRTGIAETEVI